MLVTDVLVIISAIAALSVALRVTAKVKVRGRLFPSGRSSDPNVRTREESERP